MSRKRLRILHLFSDRKLTGPAEPVLNLCSELKRQGEEILFACCSKARTKSTAVEERARESGLDPITSFRLKKHFEFTSNVQDLMLLPRFLREHEVDIVHTHLDNDHLLGARSARSVKGGIIVLRSCYKGRGPRRTVRNRYAFGRLTDGVIVPSELARSAMQEKFGFPDARTWVVRSAIDMQRFSPASVRRDMRPEFGLRPDDFVIGIVARIQARRRFHALLEAMRIASARNPKIKLLIVGRGTKMQSVAVEPVKKMGLADCVKFAGYRTGPDYVNTLGSIDAKVFLVPGTDGTCRAVREAMAMGKPVIAARRGMLPEIIDHGVNGIVLEDTPSALAEAFCHLAQDPILIRAMGEAALSISRERFRLDNQAQQVRSVYDALADMGTFAVR